MMLLWIVSILLLIPSSTAVDNTTLSDVVVNPLAKSVVINYPGCGYAGKIATLAITNSLFSQTFSFLVPQCRLKRAAGENIILNSSLNGNIQTVNVGYRITDLNASTTYTAVYTIDSVALNSIQFTTRAGQPISLSGMARSGGMVVITVLLSIGMFLLLAGLLASLFIGKK
ncbi:hypothetical protein GDO86_012825 [Hymenochirus boettgeri]|uniref:Uroplakin-2 n=1 Tax=Hymenochirus boettgeri TaxID=247094 RepID=A0A8T2INQ2_9PIPI|nr:hypothetical protein GDO86_012825 [Hymenochirus boettgeri]